MTQEEQKKIVDELYASLKSYSQQLEGLCSEVRVGACDTDVEVFRDARKAKGLSARRVIFKHALRNALIPLVTVMSIEFAAALGGAVVTETVFGWNGMGHLLITSINRQDVNLVSGWLVVVALIVVVFNLVADVLYGFLDPRIRYE